MIDEFPHQKVRLISLTKPTHELSHVVDMKIGIVSAEELIAFCARVSNPENQGNVETAAKLLKYCMDNDHWSIFEMVNLCFEIETTRDISRQILRHKSASFQEFSQRYSDEISFFTQRETRYQDLKNRQNSIDKPESISEEEHLKNEKWFEDSQEYLISMANSMYREAISRGIAKEQARALLPEGLTMSRLYMNANLRTLIHYCQLRMGNGTQKEHQDIATKIYNILVEHFSFLKEISIDDK